MTLAAANNARTDHALNKWRKDSVTGEVYTLRQRADRNEIFAIVSEVENGETVGYGFIHARDRNGVSYFTDVFNMPKLAYDALYAEGFPVAVLDHDTCTIEHAISRAYEAHLFA